MKSFFCLLSSLKILIHLTLQRLIIIYQMSNKFCKSLIQYNRRKSIEVNIGDVPCGANNTIRVQSMTTIDTMDTEGSVAQIIRMIDSGCEYVRLTAPSIKDAENLKNIKNQLRTKGYNTPLVADIHFTPNAAEVAAKIVEKVRVNPGNYADKKKFENIEYTDESYQSELERIKEKFTPLVLICKEHGTAMRIGTNHGSLSDRILSRYGDTPLGMVESALEFIRICEENEFYNLVVSMKSSNPQVMVQAYRLLVNKLDEEGLQPYPLHLGVTEAGEGEDGRVKSALGIGTLLEDGLGDTVRVSLTEEPEFEAPVAKTLVDKYKERLKHQKINVFTPSIFEYYNPFEYSKRDTNTVLNIGGSNVPVVMADFSLKKNIQPKSLFDLGYQYDMISDKWNFTDTACDYLFLNDKEINFEVPESLGVIQKHDIWLKNKRKKGYHPFIQFSDLEKGKELSKQMNILYCTLSDLTEKRIEILKSHNNLILMIDTYNAHGFAEQRALFLTLIANQIKTPVIIGKAYRNLTIEDLQIYASTDVGGLLIDGFGDGIFIAAKNCGSDKEVNQLAFNILQASRTRISKTEYISCPSCGRTLFDLQETTAMIRAKTSHLKGLKIGVMGCIVNGPGEMADADYGYVGVGVGKISLYKGQEVVKKRIDQEHALEELVNLIKEHGDWIEAEV